MEDYTYGLSGATLITPDEVQTDASLTVSNGRIAALGRPSTGHVLDLRDYLVCPGLLNAHDHLFGTWWPRVAPRRPYANVYEWLADYEKSPVLVERGQNSIDDMYELGMYRNLIAGTTTVADHFKRADSDEFYTRFPIDVLFKYGRTWTPRETTSWGDDIPTEYGRAVRTGQPYIIHLAEGVDLDAAQEMDVLTQENAVGRNTMIIHGIALRSQDIDQIVRASASVCWCPTSNLYLYEQTADVPRLLRAGVNVTLGTDSTMTGSLNLLDEVRTGRQVYRDQAGQDPESRWLVQLMTTRAAYALMLDGCRGRIEVGYEADLLVLAEGGQDPYTTLVEAEPDAIVLLIRGGVPVYGNPSYRALFEQLTPSFTTVDVAGTQKLIAGNPLALLERISARVGTPIEFPFLPCTAPASEVSGT